MTVSDVLRALRKQWWIVAACLVVGVAGASLWNAKSTPIYQARVTFFVGMPASASDAGALAGDQFASSRVNSYVRLLSSDATAQAVRDSGVDIPLPSIKGSISGSADLNTVLLTATVRNASKKDALAIATAIGTRFGVVVAQNDPQARPQAGDDTGRAIELRVVTGPSVGADPVAPSTRLNVLLGLIAGMAIGGALALAREVGDTAVRTSEDLEQIGGAAVLGSIPYDRAARQAPVILNRARAAARAEAVRKIRTGLLFADVDSALQVLAISSALPGEGKSSTTLNLGVATAESDLRVLIIDCDLRNPAIGKYTGLPGVIGLTDLLAQRASFADVARRWGRHNLDIIPCGTLPPNPSELLGSKAMQNLIADVRSRYDLILLDTPPLLPVTDAVVTAGHADGVALVVRHKTSRVAVRRALQSLHAAGARVIGTILTMTPTRSREDAYGYRYGTGNGAQLPVQS